jgi:hypothetical protein
MNGGVSIQSHQKDQGEIRRGRNLHPECHHGLDFQRADPACAARSSFKQIPNQV